MILALLEIQNYKHYAGEHRIEPPPQGIVGVIGANGVGKTSLFEAIEWCLYNPTDIHNAEVPPRGGVGGTRVRVTLEDPRDGNRWVIERSLRKSVATAEIYREDQPESPVVQGSRQVSDYVARSLIGLGHRAFVSTFFTRQKELTFFGNLKETERRREVARLLGFETIRDAQNAIGEERSRARAEATSFRLQVQDAASGRDLDAELVAMNEQIGVREVETTAAAERLVMATKGHTAARDALDRWRALERQDAMIAHDITRLTGEERTAEAQRDAASAALRLLDEAARTRAGLIREAIALDQRLADVATHEKDRERLSHLRTVQADLARAERDHAEVTRRARETVAAVASAAAEVPDWTWQPADEHDPTGAIRRRVAAVDALDIERACEHAVALEGCRVLVEKRDEIGSRAANWAGALKQLEQKRGTLLATGDPAVTIKQIDVQREAAIQAAQGALTAADGAAAERERLSAIAASLEASHFDEECPTCGRPFAEHEASDVVRVLHARIADLQTRESELAIARREALIQSEQADAVKRQETTRQAEINQLEGRIADGKLKVAEVEAQLQVVTQHCAEAITQARLAEEPTPALLATVKGRADHLQRLGQTVSPLQTFADAVERATEQMAGATRSIEGIGPVAYDPDAHAAAQRALETARSAIARIGQIDSDLARRPTHERDQRAATDALVRLAVDRERLAGERATIGFNAAALTAAETQERAALAEERAAAEARNSAQAALRDSTIARDAILADQARLVELGRRADARSREADELDLMYREFTRFDQYVAERVTPALAEQTGELLSAVTGGRYDRVEFDENYGLKIFDDDEKFPVEEFSGGERDVAALCARLALSRLIGGQAAHPPGFLVLDEVFGSLDQDRRAHVLETLGSLATGTEAFRQLFIISHVDDIRLSPIFDAVWRVSEADGTSVFEDVTRGIGIEDFST